MKQGPPLEPLYHFDRVTGQNELQQLYANDRARAEARAAESVVVPNQAHMSVISNPDMAGYTSGTTLGF